MKQRLLRASTTTLLLSLLSVGATANPTQKQLIASWMELDGRACYGYFRVTDQYVDFYTPYFDCHRMRYSNIYQSDESIQLGDQSYKSVWLFVDKPTKSCPFYAVEILSRVSSEAQSSREVIAYTTKDSFENYRWGTDRHTGQSAGNEFLLTCAAYPLEPNEKARLKPESQRVKPQVLKK